VTARAIRTAAAAALALLAPAARASGPGASDPPVAVRAGTVFTGAGTLSPGVVVIERGKVVSVGRSLPASATGRVVDLPGGWVTPGWVDAASTAGLPEADEFTREVTPSLRPLAVFDPSAREVRRALAAGVTSLFLEPGSANVVGGLASVVKTAPGGDGGTRVVKADAALKIAFGYDPTSGNFPARGIPANIYARRPTTRMGVLAVLRDAWLLGRLAGEGAEDPGRAAVARAAAGALPVRVHARHAEDLRALLRLREEMGIRPVVEGATEGWRVAEPLSKAGLGCVVGPIAWPVSGRGPEGTEPALDNAGILHRAGVALALTAGGDPANLRDQAALAVRYGLPRDAALRAVTGVAAAHAGAGDRVGTLAAGRDADLVLFTGDPLEPASRVRMVIVDGEVAYDDEEAK
jgi:imidazolonepropionase-like amidohydrolase